MVDMPITGIRDSFGRDIPVMCPMWIFEPWEAQAQENHQQTLARLRERGGVDVVEAVAILTGQRWRAMPMRDAHRQFVALVSAAHVYRRALEAERDRYKSALERHLCEYDMADWVACCLDHTEHAGCEICASEDAGQHRHALLVRAETAEAERDQLRAVLTHARDAIASLPEDALGFGQETVADLYGEPCLNGWPLRDELLSRITRALTPPPETP